MATATEAALAEILGPADTILSNLDDVLDPELVIEANNVRVTLAWFRQKAGMWQAARAVPEVIELSPATPEG
jgi:hypothetical protein